MTTAHRPTFDPARGGTGRGESDLSKLSTQYASRDLPSHKTLKYRQPGQAHPDEVREKNLRFELEEKEREARDRKRERDGITEAIEGSSAPEKKSRFEPAFDADADEPTVDDSDRDDTDDDDDDTDDDAELMAELEKIKKERAAEKARKEEEALEEQERARHEAMIRGNPLLNLNDEEAGYRRDKKLMRRWDDDVVFKNCAKGISERKKEATFINDSIRSEFHRKFMDKYIK